jgi:hypothetical protein
MTVFVENNLNAINSLMSGNTAIFDELSAAAASYIASTKGDINELDFLFTQISTKNY